MILQIVLLQQPVQNTTIIDSNRESFDSNALKQVVDDEQCFNICCVTGAADCVEVTLHELTESTTSRPLTAPNRTYVIPPKGSPQRLYVLCCKPCQWHGQVEPHGNVTISLVQEPKHLFVRFFATFAQQDFGILERRSVDGSKPIAAVYLSSCVDQKLASHHLIRQDVSESAEGLRFDLSRF